MDPTYVPHLLEDELTHELTIRGLPDVGSIHEKRNVLDGILTSLAVAFPVQPAKPDDDHAEYTVCQQKLQQMSVSIQSLLTNPSRSVDSLRIRLDYLKGRIFRITANNMRVQLLLVWAQLIGELNSKRDTLMARTGDLLTSEEAESRMPATATGQLPSETSFIDRVFQLTYNSASASTQPAPIATAPFLPLLQSSFSVPLATPRVPVCPVVDAAPNVVYNKYLQVSRWNVKYNGDGSVNAFIERIEEKAASHGMNHEQLFQQAGELFVDNALVWYRFVKPEVHSWTELVQRLRSAFLPSDYEYELWDEIRARTQGPDEKVELFVAVMQNLMSRFAQPVPEMAKLQLILRNLQPKFQTEMLVRQCTTLSQLVATCKSIEDTAHRLTAFKNPPTRTNSLLEPELAYRRHRSTVHQAETSTNFRSVCWNCQSPDHRSISCPKPKRKYCFSCGKPEVTRLTCPKCKDKTKNGKTAVEKSTGVPSSHH